MPHEWTGSRQLLVNVSRRRLRVDCGRSVQQQQQRPLAEELHQRHSSSRPPPPPPRAPPPPLMSPAPRPPLRPPLCPPPVPLRHCDPHFARHGDTTPPLCPRRQDEGPPATFSWAFVPLIHAVFTMVVPANNAYGDRVSSRRLVRPHLWPCLWDQLAEGYREDFCKSRSCHHSNLSSVA
jgi:hypothetical protein